MAGCNTEAIYSPQDGDTIVCKLDSHSVPFFTPYGCFTDSCAKSATFLRIRGWNILPLIGLRENGDGSEPLSCTSWAGWKSILGSHLASVRGRSAGGCR